MEDLTDVEATLDEAALEISMAEERCNSVMESQVLDTTCPTAKKRKTDMQTPEYEDTSFFNADWITFIKKYDSTHFGAGFFSNSRKVWLVYYPNRDFPSQSRYACRLCQNHAGIIRQSESHVASLSSPEGYRAATYALNKAKIRTHEVSATHLRVLKSLKEQEKNTMDVHLAKAKEVLEKKLGDKYEVTGRVILTVYTAVITDISLEAHKTLIEM